MVSEKPQKFSLEIIVFPYFSLPKKELTTWYYWIVVNVIVLVTK